MNYLNPTFLDLKSGTDLQVYTESAYISEFMVSPIVCCILVMHSISNFVSQTIFGVKYNIFLLMKILVMCIHKIDIIDIIIHV